MVPDCVFRGYNMPSLIPATNMPSCFIIQINTPTEALLDTISTNTVPVTGSVFALQGTEQGV